MRGCLSFGIVGLLVLGSCLCILLATSEETRAITWAIETVDSDGEDVGGSPDQALDSLGNPHISYGYIDYPGHPDKYGVRYASWTGTTWRVELVDPTPAGFGTSLAIDSLDRAHFSYYTGHLKYASWTGSLWKVETVDSKGNVGQCSSLVLDSMERPHVSYIDATNKALKYAWWDGSGWRNETVDSAGVTVCATSLALNATEVPHISYVGKSNAEVKHAWRTGSGWANETIDSGGSAGYCVSLALDSTDRLGIAYSVDKSLRYAAQTGGGWDLQPVDAPGLDGWCVSLALDRSDNPRISFDRHVGDLMYASRTGGVWSVETVESGLNCGRSSSLILTSSGNVGIAYHSDLDGTLRYARAPDNTPPAIAITSPAGGEVWRQGESRMVTWTASDREDPPSSLFVFINYTSSAGGGRICGPVTGVAGSCAWTLPVLSAADFVVNATVLDTGGLKGHDDSGPFTIQAPPAINTPPTVTITSPAGGEVWDKGSSHNVTWSMQDAQDVDSNLIVFVNFTTGGTTTTIVAGMKGIETFLWTLPDIEATDVVVNITVIDTGGLKGWDQSGPFTIKAPPPPASVEANYKPVVAVIFAVILAVAGVWSSTRRPLKGREGKEAVLKAFAVFSLPFVLAEAGTGIVSFLTGQLSIPPVMGVGTAVDLAILVSGISIAVLRAPRQRKPGEEETADAPGR